MRTFVTAALLTLPLTAFTQSSGESGLEIWKCDGVSGQGELAVITVHNNDKVAVRTMGVTYPGIVQNRGMRKAFFFGEPNSEGWYPYGITVSADGNSGYFTADKNPPSSMTQQFALSCTRA